jgi:hypothetical protein
MKINISGKHITIFRGEELSQARNQNEKGSR